SIFTRGLFLLGFMSSRHDGLTATFAKLGKWQAAVEQRKGKPTRRPGGLGPASSVCSSNHGSTCQAPKQSQGGQHEEDEKENLSRFPGHPGNEAEAEQPRNQGDDKEHNGNT